MHGRCEAVGRYPDTVEIIANGMWRELDIRKGLDAEPMRDEIGRLHEGGTDWAAFNACGDDLEASLDTVQWFSDEIIAG